MKKKIIFAVATGLFALATVFNMNVLQINNAGDLSLEAIAVMAQATNEGNIVDGYGPSSTTVCNIPGGTCDVSAQDPDAAGY